MTILNKNLRYFKNDLIVAYPRFNRLIGSLCVGRLRQVLRGIRPISFTRNTTPFVDMKSGGLLLSRAFSINKNAEGEYIAPNEINSAKSLHQFYSFLIKGKIFVVEEAVGKKPLRNAFNRIPLDLSTISQKWFGQLRLSLDESMPRKVIIVDLDLQKEDWGGNVDIVRKVKSTIIGLAKKYDFTLVESPSGGLHAYFSNDAFGCVKNDLSRTVNCGLKEVDLLTTGISSPSIFERKILNISSIWIKPSSQLNAEVPKALMPVLADKTHEKALRKAFCNKYPYPLQKGQRALNLLTIWGFNNRLTKEELFIINEDFGFPPLNKNEFVEIEKPSAAVGSKLIPSLVNSDTLNILYDMTAQEFYTRREDGYWYQTSLVNWYRSSENNARELLNNMPYNTMRGLLQVQCGIESLSNEKDLFEKEVFPDSFPIYSDDGIYRFSNGVFEKVDSSILNKYRILFQEPIPSSLFLALGEENLTIGSLDDLYSEIKDKCPVLYDWFWDLFKEFNFEVRSYLVRGLICSFGLCFFKGYKGYGLALKLAKIIILTGPGGTGKSTASEALKGMLPSYASQTLELRHLSGRFETSAMAGKKILAFSDELLESFGKEKGLKTLADMNRISGEKVMRGEIKHQSHIPIMIEGQVILNTNSVFATPQLELYSAIKRRYAVFPFLSFRQGAKEDFVETLKEDLTKLKIIFTRSESLIPQITGVLKKFDLEDALLEHKDYKHYEMYTDPFNSFFREGLEEDPNGIMPMNQLYTHMINYLKDRKGSLLEIHNIMEYEKSMKESLERPDKWLVMEDHFPNVPGLQKISQSKARSMMGTIEARKPFVDLIRKVFFKRKKLTYSYEVEKNDGQGNEVRTEITRNGLFLMIHGVRAKTIDEQKVEIPSEPTNYSEGGTFQDLIDAIVKVKTKKIPEGNIGIKRPRGRPRLTEEELLIRSKAEAKKIKRSRGRPKKTIGPSYPTSKFTGQSNNFPRRAFSTLRDSGPLDFKSKSRIDKIKEIINYLCIKEELHPRKHPLTGDISKPPFSFPGATILSKRINYIYNKQQDWTNQVLNKNTFELYNERGIMASEYPLNKADIIYRKNQLAFIKKLEGHFGSQLAFLLHGVLVRSFYNQEVSFDKEKEVESGWPSIKLNSLIFSLWLNLERREDFQSNFYHLDRSRNETGLLALQEEKESLKKNKANLEPKRYKEELADLNIRIRTAKKGLKKLDSLDEYIGKIISDFLNMILDSGGKVSQESKGRKYKYIHFHFWKEINFLEAYSHLSKKPMAVPPKDWSLDPASSNEYAGPCSGGYLLNKDLHFATLYKRNKMTRPAIKWSQSYIDKINQLQSFPLYVNFELIREISHNYLNKIHQTDIPKLFEVFKKWKDIELNLIQLKDESPQADHSEKEREKHSLYSSIKHHVGSIFKKLEDLALVNHISKTYWNKKDRIVTLYSPISVEISLRMNSPGVISVYSNKLFREFVTFPDINGPFPGKPKDDHLDLLRRFFLTAKIKRPVSLDSAMNRDEILSFKTDCPAFLSSRDKYLLGAYDTVWLDATAQALQIYSLLFGDIEMAEMSNLGFKDKYNDIYTSLIQKILKKEENQETLNNWPEKFLYVINDRGVIKGEIQFFLYGSVVLGSINRILEIHPNLTPNEAREITIFLRENLKEIFSFAFRLKEIFRKIQNAKADGYLFEGHTWNLQGNIFKIPYYKSKEERRRFSIDKLNASNRFVIDRLTWDLDKAKSLRAFQPMLFHSIDARVNVELRLRLKEKFNICVPSVHDSFAVPIDLIDLVKYEYKQVMFEEVLDKDLEDLFIFSKKVPTKIIEDFKGLNSEIRIRKKNAIFSDMRGHVGGWPLYPA